MLSRVPDYVGARQLKKQPKPSKLRNVKTIVDGLSFDSKKEAKRYAELKLLVKAGDVSNLELQRSFELIPKQKLSSGKTERACHYIADFVYCYNGKTWVEDVKGMRTGQAYALFVVKRKLMLLVHGIEVIEV